jgi:aminomethyltransferase
MTASTPLYQRHVAARASMVEFAGYLMPIKYTSMRDEHVAVRTRAGLFDLSHMGEVRITGPTSEAALQAIVTNDVSRLHLGAALYTVMCNDEGGIIDDLIVYRVEDGFMVVVNASRRSVDIPWIREHLSAGAELRDESDSTALLAVQGPEAGRIVQPLTGVRLDGLRPFHSTLGSVAGATCRISRTGYTGEDGFELFCDPAAAAALWDALVEVGEPAGMLLAGLGARDTLRLEAGMRLYGQDMDETVDPFSCGLAWTVKLDKGDFVGAARLRQLDGTRSPRRFVGLSLGRREIARHGMPVLASAEVVGVVTSGAFSWTLGHGIATAYVPRDLPETEPLAVDIRGQIAPAQRARLPFVKRPAPPQ